jgi:hypothetical protein
VLGALSCTTATQRSTGGAGHVAHHDELFSHILAEITSNRAHVIGELRVDPRPLGDSPEIADVSEADYVTVSGEALAKRVERVLSLGIDTASTIRWSKCVYLLPGATVADACPKGSMTVVSVGSPRRGGAYFPNAGRDDREAGAKSGHQSVRVSCVTVGPYGRMVVASDFVVRRQGPGWVTVEEVPLVIIE